MATKYFEDIETNHSAGFLQARPNRRIKWGRNDLSRWGWHEDARHYIRMGHLPATIKTDPNSRCVFLAILGTEYIESSTCATPPRSPFENIRDMSFRSKTFSRKWAKVPRLFHFGNNETVRRAENCGSLLVARAFTRSWRLLLCTGRVRRFFHLLNVAMLRTHNLSHAGCTIARCNNLISDTRRRIYFEKYASIEK